MCQCSHAEVAAPTTYGTWTRHAPDHREVIPTFGTAELFRFPNGYGASVARNAGTYGAGEGLFEVAVLDEHDQLTYDTPVHEYRYQTFGWLNTEQVEGLLDRIQALPKGGTT